MLLANVDVGILVLFFVNWQAFEDGMDRTAWICASLLATNARASTDATSRAVVTNPQASIGQTVTVCGRLTYRFEDTNLGLAGGSWSVDSVGLNVNPGAVSGDSLQLFHGRHVCATGTISRAGCAHERICTRSHYDYAIAVDAVNNR